MKKTILFLALIFISANSVTYSQMWMRSYNGSGNGNDVSRAVRFDAADNVYITGYTTVTGGSKNIITIKYDPAGNLQWSAVYNGTGNGSDEAYAITLDAAANVYIAGYTTGNNSGRDIITIKYNSNGIQQWAARYTSPGNYPDEAYAITLDNAGNTYVAGYSYDEQFDNQMTVIKYNPAGVQQWIAKYGNSGSENKTDVAYAITIDAANNIYVAGSSSNSGTGKDFTTIKYNSSGVQQWVKKYNGSANDDDEAYAITIDAASNIYVTGYTSGGNTGKDYLTIKYNSAGTQQWLSTYNNSSANRDDIPRAIYVTNNNDVIVTGSSMSSNAANSEDYLTINYNSANGSVVFAARYNDTIANSSDIAYAIGVATSGSADNISTNAIYITGSSRQTPSAGSEDIVTLKYNPAGVLQQKFRIVNPGPDAAYDINVDSHKNFVLAGYLSTTTNGLDMVAAKYAAPDILSITNLESGVPKAFRLYQNYPNPFNPSTNIKFGVSAPGIVKLVIFDGLGREVMTPVNEFLNAGYYEISVPMGSLSSGLYFYKMSSSTFTDLKKMILLK